MMLYAHGERTESLCLRDVASDIIGGHETHFGKFVMLMLTTVLMNN